MKELVMSRIQLLSLFVVSCLLSGFCTESSAQATRRPLVRAGKFLGLGWGAGNHWRNPAVNSGYFNPYTMHNSNLFAPTYSHLPGYYDTNKGLLNSYGSPHEPSRPAVHSSTDNSQETTYPATFRPLEFDVQPNHGFGDFEIDSSRTFSEPFNDRAQNRQHLKEDAWPKTKESAADSH